MLSIAWFSSQSQSLSWCGAGVADPLLAVCEPLYPSPPPPAPAYSTGDVSLDGVLDIGDIVLMACGAKQESGKRWKKGMTVDVFAFVDDKSRGEDANSCWLLFAVLLIASDFLLSSLQLQVADVIPDNALYFNDTLKLIQTVALT